jgi:large subunit ribosomal protein L9
MSQVKLILTESVHSLGEAGDLVNVKPGFARNFLLPQGKAILATASRVKELEHHKRRVADKVAREMKDLTAAKKRLEGIRIEVSARAGEEGKLFGSVTTAQIAEKLAEQGFEIDRRRIDLKEPIKEVGEHSVAVKLHRELVARIAVVVEGAGSPPPEREVDEDREDDRRREDSDDDHDEDDED